MNIQGITSSLQRVARSTPDRIYATTETGTITFRQLNQAATIKAAELMAEGLKPGDRVVLMMSNSIASLATIFGLLRAGLIWVPVNPSLVGDALRHVLQTTEPALVLCDPEVAGAFAGIPEARDLRIQPVVDKGLPVGDASFDQPHCSPSDTAAIMFTSGSTGPAKGVIVSHMMLELAAEGVALCADVKPGDNMFMWEPFYHIGGAQVILLPLFREVGLTIADRFSASRFWQQVSEGGCTHIHHLGGIIQILLKQPPNDWEKRHKVRIAWGGGCAVEAWRPFEERFSIQIRECYGMTECSSLTSWNDEWVLGSVGRAMPWFSITLYDADGRILGPNEGRGEIVVNTTLPGAITQGYFRNPEASAKALRPEGFRTGDLGSWNSDGMLFFHGRMSDSVRCKGENVSAFEVESVIGQHPDILDVAMIGVPTDVGEYDIMLYIQPKAEVSPDLKAIAAWAAERLAPHQRPRYYKLIDTFPRTPSQRILKHQLPRDVQGAFDISRPTT